MGCLRSLPLAFCLLLAVVAAKTQERVRTERGLLGEKEVPVDAYYGVQTARALENFKISGVDINRWNYGEQEDAGTPYGNDDWHRYRLNPSVGYEKATELAGEAYKSGKSIMEVIREKKILSEAQIQQLLDPSS